MQKHIDQFEEAFPTWEKVGKDTFYSPSNKVKFRVEFGADCVHIVASSETRQTASTIPYECGRRFEVFTNFVMLGTMSSMTWHLTQE